MCRRIPRLDILPSIIIAYEIINGHSIHPNSYCDIICTSGWFPLQFIAESTPTSILASPYLSSNRAPAESFVGYPTTFISLGGAEVFVEEARELGEKMREAGVDITIDIQVWFLLNLYHHRFHKKDSNGFRS